MIRFGSGATVSDWQSATSFFNAAGWNRDSRLLHLASSLSASPLSLVICMSIWSGLVSRSCGGSSSGARSWADLAASSQSCWSSGSVLASRQGIRNERTVSVFVNVFWAALDRRSCCSRNDW